MNDPGRRLAHQDPVSEISVFGHDRETVLLGVGPQLRVGPSVVEIVDLDVLRAVPDGEVVGQIDVDQVPVHLMPEL